MEGPVCFRDVIPYGSLENGTLTLTKGFSLTVPFSGISECMLVSANVRFEGEALPTIQFSLWVDGQEESLYLSHAYTFGKADGFSMKEWRVPPMMQSDMSARLEVVIPEGTTVFLRGMSARYDAHFSEWKTESGRARGTCLGLHRVWEEWGFCYSLLNPLSNQRESQKPQGSLAQGVQVPFFSRTSFCFQIAPNLFIAAGFSFIRHSISLPFIIYLLLLFIF